MQYFVLKTRDNMFYLTVESGTETKIKNRIDGDDPSGNPADSEYYPFDCWISIFMENEYYSPSKYSQPKKDTPIVLSKVKHL